MNFDEIHSAIAAKFGSAIESVETDNPDPYIVLKRESLREVAQFLRDDKSMAFDFLESISGVDDTEKLHCVYHLFSYTHRHSLVLKLYLSYEDTLIDSVQDIWPAANWHEREQYDLFGFDYQGHPDLRRLLLPEDWIGWPLRKDYEYPEEYHGIDHYRPDPKEQFAALDDLAKKAAEKAAAKRAEDAASNEAAN